MALIGNLSGSLTTLTSGKGLIRAGSNITIVSGSTIESGEHFITIAGAAASAIAADDITAGDAAISIATTSGNITIDAQANDADVIIKVDDNGSAVTAVTFDGSDEGNAIFVNDLKLQSDAAAIHFGANDDIVLTHEADRGLVLTQATETTGEPVFTIKNTGNLASGGGIDFVLDNGAGEGDDDVLGFLAFKGDDGGNAETQFATMAVLATDITAGDESGQFIFSAFAGGTAGTAASKQLLNIGGEDVANGGRCEVVVNQDSIDCDFRVESNSFEEAFLVDAGKDQIILFGSGTNNCNLFVSGAKSATSDNAGPTNSLGAHFGGDIVVSGNLYNGGITYANTVVAGATVTAATNLLVGADIVHLGDTDTKIGFTADKVIHTVGNIEYMQFVEDDSQDAVIFNEGGVDIDFRVETADNANTIFLQGSTNQIYFGTATAAATDVHMFVSGNNNMGDRHNAKGAVTVFGGGVILSGSCLPGVDNSIDLGGENNRFANVYTGDLSLRNDRGNWTLIEEAGFISFRNNDSGKRYKMLMEEITGDGSYGPGNDGVL